MAYHLTGDNYLDDIDARMDALELETRLKTRKENSNKMITVTGRQSHKARIELHMTPLEVFRILSEGNPGALRVLLEMYQKSSSIDPEAALEGLAPLIHLDSFGIYGSRIWMLYKDVCGQDLTYTLGMLRAVQMGVLPETELHLAIDGVKSFDVSETLQRLKQVLPSFGQLYTCLIQSELLGWEAIENAASKYSSRVRKSWGSNYGELLTLLELLRIHGWIFVRTASLAVQLKTEIRNLHDSSFLRLSSTREKKWKELLERWEPSLTNISEHCERAELGITSRHCLETVHKIRRQEIREEDCDALVENLTRELRTIVLLSIPYLRREFFEQPRKDWEQVLTVFPNAQEDIEEMNRCFALSRYTAAVFHSLLVVEHGLIALGKQIGVTDPKPGWDATYNQLRKMINDRSLIPSNLDFNFLEQTKSRLDSMKMAWRNKVNHAAGRLIIEKTGFNDVSAEEVIIACRSFMRHLAEGLPSSEC